MAWSPERKDSSGMRVKRELALSSMEKRDCRSGVDARRIVNGDGRSVVGVIFWASISSVVRGRGLWRCERSLSGDMCDLLF